MKFYFLNHNNMFQLKCSIEKVSTLANKCLSILIHTQDISLYKEAELSELFKLNEKDVWVAFKEVSIKEEDLKVEDNLDVGEQKSPHKRVYDIILAYCKVKDGNFNNSREIYKKLMNNIADTYLEKIREIEEAKNIVQK